MTTDTDLLARLPALLDGVTGLLGRRDLTQQEVQNWWAGSSVGGPGNDGLYPATHSSGFVRMLPSPERMAISNVGFSGPESFGAIGDGNYHAARTVFATLEACRAVYPLATSLAQEMDFLAWQKMVRTTGTYVCPSKRHYKMCNGDAASHHPLDWICGVSEVDANYSFLDWGDLRARYTDEHLVANYDFASAAGWVNADFYGPLQHVDATFDQGRAMCRDPYDGTNAPAGTNPYYEFGYPVNIPVGRYRLRVKGHAWRGQSYDHGNFNPPYYIVGFSGDPIGQGASVTTRNAAAGINLDPIDPAGVRVPFETVIDFRSNGVPGHVTFKGAGYVNFDVELVDIQPWLPNCAIHYHHDGSPSQYFLHRRLKRAVMFGSENKALRAGLTGILTKSFEEIDGNLQDLEDVEMRFWNRALSYGDGAYLIRYFNVNIGNCDVAVHFPAGLANAGENLLFIGGSISGNDVGIDNSGFGEFSLLGTIFDYNKQGVINNNGTIRLTNTRHEQHLPETYGRPIWHCTVGKVIYTGCKLLFVGSPNEQPAWLDSSMASIEFHGCDIYNMGAANGVVVKGAGRINFHGFMNTGNQFIGPDLVSTNQVSDVLGGAGLFEPPVLSAFAAEPIGIEGGLFVGGDEVVFTDRWTSDFLKAEVTTERRMEGTRCLKITKLKPADNTIDCRAQFLIPVERVGNLLGVQYFQFPHDIDASWTEPLPAPIYHRMFWVQVLGHDALGRPRYSPTTRFQGGVNLDVPLVGNPAWVKRKIDTMYHQAEYDGRYSAGERSPDWATHLLIQLDMQSIPAGSFYLDGFRANFIG